MNVTSLGHCPYCGVEFGVTDNAVVHALPMCTEFKEQDPLTYLRGVRLKVIGPLPDDDEWG